MQYAELTVHVKLSSYILRLKQVLAKDRRSFTERMDDEASLDRTSLDWDFKNITMTYNSELRRFKSLMKIRCCYHQLIVIKYMEI